MGDMADASMEMDEDDDSPVKPIEEKPIRYGKRKTLREEIMLRDLKYELRRKCDTK